MMFTIKQRPYGLPILTDLVCVLRMPADTPRGLDKNFIVVFILVFGDGNSFATLIMLMM